MKDLFEERYKATPAALDRDDIIEHLLDASEEDDKHELIFNKCAAMIKQYKISANPDWDLSDILDTFSTKQLQELLQYVMDSYKNESLHEEAEELEIPAPYNKYYELGSTEIDYNALPDAFDHYKELKVVAEVYAKDEYDAALSDNTLEFIWLVSDRGRLLFVTTAGLRVYPVTLEEIEECISSHQGYDEDDYDDDDLDDYDDYEEYNDLYESVEITDAQRLTLDMLDSYLEYGEITAVQHNDSQNIQWDINWEDIVLFINGIDVPLKDIKHVGYGDCEKYDGCYVVTMNDNTVRKYGWYDFDMTGALHYIDSHQIQENTSQINFQPGDHVYVSVANRRGRVRKMITSDLVEVELDDNGVYPARIDRYYTNGVELLFSENDIEESSKQTETNAINKTLTEEVTNITWEDLQEYKYAFSVTPKYAPNATFGDDCRRVAGECGCIHIYYQNARFHPQSKFLCKSPEQYDKLVEIISTNKYLRDYPRFSSLKTFDITDVKAELTARFSNEVLRHKQNNSPSKRTKKVFTPAVRKILLKYLPCLYVTIGNSDSIELPLEYEESIFDESVIN